MTPDELRKVEARYQRAARRAEEARQDRNRMIVAAIDAGWTHAQIANATGLTRARVGQIALADSAAPDEFQRPSEDDR